MTKSHEDRIEALVASMLTELGEDPKREGLEKTFEHMKGQEIDISNAKVDGSGDRIEVRFSMRRRITWSDGRSTAENRTATLGLSRSGRDWRIQRLAYR